MKTDELNQLLSYLTARDGAIIHLSKKDVDYLIEETAISVYEASIEDALPDRMKRLREKIDQQISSVINDFPHRLFLLEVNPEHELRTEELKIFFHDDLAKDFTLWGLKWNSQIPSVKMTIVRKKKTH